MCFYCIPYKCKIEQTYNLQHNGMTNSEMEMCMWKYIVLLWVLEIDFLEDGKCTTIRVRSSGSSFCRGYQVTKGRPCRSWQIVQGIEKCDSLHLWHGLFFQFARFITEVLLHAPSMISVYAKLSRLSTHCPREREREMRTCKNFVYNARLEISRIKLQHTLPDC